MPKITGNTMNLLKDATIGVIITLFALCPIGAMAQSTRSYPFVYITQQGEQAKLISNTKVIVYRTTDSTSITVARPWVKTAAENYIFRIKANRNLEVTHTGSYARGISHYEMVEITPVGKNRWKINFFNGSQPNFTLFYTRTKPDE